VKRTKHMHTMITPQSDSHLRDLEMWLSTPYNSASRADAIAFAAEVIAAAIKLRRNDSDAAVNSIATLVAERL